ncbi:MAG: hypothetical protein K2H43_01860, partial [Clostridia bacterium]|nr:hypothetical protein [Clostridia bacterium]
RFQKMFRITCTDAEGDGYKTWVFKNPDLAPADFPEDASLQRHLKRYILAGGKVGHAGGVFLA